ncbi:hypothetical protein, partial [Burkholderia gladioli]|uniref:hypothetical protein n=1 Tax=Burkholderia gladioli TaxID=28095 RepID=UPI003F7AFF4C
MREASAEKGAEVEKRDASIASVTKRGAGDCRHRACDAGQAKGGLLQAARQELLEAFAAGIAEHLG